jgi:hypothetical protein
MEDDLGIFKLVNSDLVLDCVFNAHYGAFQSNGKNVTCSTITVGANLTEPQILDGTVTLTGTGSSFIAVNTISGSTSDYSTSKIVYTDVSSTTKALHLTAQTPSTVQLGSLTIPASSGAFSFPKDSGTASPNLGNVSITGPVTITFDSTWGTIAVAQFSIVTGAGNSVTMNTTSAGNAVTFQKSTPGNLVAGPLSLKDIHASNTSGFGRFYATAGSVDNGNNTGWIFGNPPLPESLESTVPMSQAVRRAAIW